MHNVRNITEDLYWIGANDRRLALFENIHPIPEGVSYNSYMLLDEKTVVFDTVDWSVTRQYIENIEYLLNGRELDYLVVHHMEPDHCGAIEELALRYPNLKIISSEKGFMFMRQFGYKSINGHQLIEAKEGDKFKFGKHEIVFLEAPMVHWPEVLVSFDTTNGALFSADAFGTFGTLNGNIFKDEVDFEGYYLSEMRRYYTNIVGKYGMQVQNVFKKLKDIAINMIVPLHGPIWRTPEDINYLLDLYNKWSTSTPEKDGVVLVYGSMYGNTENTVNCIANKLAQKGVKDIKVFDVSKTHPSYIISEAWKYSNLVLAAPTYNTGLYLVMDSLLHELASLGYQNRKVSLIGNHTWATGALGAMKKKFETEFKKIEVVGEPLDVKSALRPEQEEVLDNLTEAIVESMN